MPRLTSALRRAGILDWESPRTLWRMARVLGCIIVDDELSPVVEKTAHSAPRVVAGPPDGSIEALIASAKSAALPSRRRRGRVVLLTSGTTGAPKGAARVPKFGALAGPLTTLLSELPLRARDRLFV